MKRLLSLIILMLWTMNLFACGSPSFSDELPETEEIITDAIATEIAETEPITTDGIDKGWQLDRTTKYVSISYNAYGQPSAFGVSEDPSVSADGGTLFEYRFLSNERYTDTSSIRKFTLNGRQSLVVIPDEPLEGNPTVWRTEFFEAFDTVDKTLLEKGWHIIYHNVSDMYGAPSSLAMMHEFQDFVTVALGLSGKPVLFGFSRGGLYAVNYAAEYPDCVGGIYLDAPVQDIRDWPCRDDMKGTRERKECMSLYGLTDETLPFFDGNPIDKAEKIADIPLIIVAGLADTTVVWERNGAITAERVKAAGGHVKTILKENCEHHPHSLDDPTPVVEFIEKYCM
ncbi:MAG: alpha/beta hydrolase [Clostridia bacterium]|nr:alpha/beta hydrolase [Clostridia bacterium]